MPILLSRNLPDDVYQGLAARARAGRRSLAQQAVEELRRALRLGDSGRVAGTVERMQASGRRLPVHAPRPEALLCDGRETR